MALIGDSKIERDKPQHLEVQNKEQTEKNLLSQNYLTAQPVQAAARGYERAGPKNRLCPEMTGAETKVDVLGKGSVGLTERQGAGTSKTEAKKVIQVLGGDKKQSEKARDSHVQDLEEVLLPA